jgi:acetyl-CoA acetyltransferase
MTGLRIVITLISEMKRRSLKKGPANLRWAVGKELQ